jgi:hypothetical protein
VAVSPAGEVTGYYREELGTGVTRTCSFFVGGKLGPSKSGAGARAAVSSWSSSRYPGALEFKDADVVLTIAKGREHPGCGSVMMPEIATGLTLEKTFPAAWTSLRQVAVAKAYFHATADPAKRQRAYIVAGDVVGVLQEKGGWLQVEYPVQSGERRQAWLRAADTAAVVPK